MKIVNDIMWKRRTIFIAVFLFAVLLAAPLAIPQVSAEDSELEFKVNGGGIAGLDLDPTVPGAEMLLEVNHYKKSPFGPFDEAVYYLLLNINPDPSGPVVLKYVPVLILVDNDGAAGVFASVFAPVPVVALSDTSSLEVSKYDDGHVTANVPSATIILGPVSIPLPPFDLAFDEKKHGAKVKIKADLPGFEAGTNDREAVVEPTSLPVSGFDPEQILLPPGATIKVDPPGPVSGLIRKGSELEIGGD